VLNGGNPQHVPTLRLIERNVLLGVTSRLSETIQNWERIHIFFNVLFYQLKNPQGVNFMCSLEVKRKLAAILSADVKGYSRLMGEKEIETIRTITTYRKIMANFIGQHKGRVVDSPGDNLLAEFVSVVEAVQCAVEIQKELKLKNAELPENSRMEFRIGINLGDVIEEGERIYGDGVNVTARVQSLADGGGVCISGTAYDQVENKLGLGYEYLGEQTVKNIAKPVRVYRIMMEAGTFAPTEMIEQQIKFCTTVDCVRIAYSMVGQGPFLVIPPGWVSHLQLQWEHPSARDYLEKGTRNHTFLFYDKHGCGLSERNRTEFTLESEVRPLEAVIDHLKLKRFALFGFSCAGSTAIAYAIKYPKRVSHLILYGSYARGEAITTEEFKKSFSSLIRSAWGVGSKSLADMFLPGADASALKWFTRLQREAATAEMASRLIDFTYNLNVTDLLPRLRVPTLVMHRKGDKVIPFHLGMEMASLIPNSRFVPLEGDIHIPFFGDADAVLRIMGVFLSTPAH
jgi:class 3 adenylate cyclase/pimeloyl-ACP methyl ester carboxylesterase